MATTAAKPITKTSASAAKAPRKPAAKKLRLSAKVAVKPRVKSVIKPVSAPKIEKTNKDKKPKLVRDSFTIPKAEYTVLDELKQRTGKLAVAAKKSELIRAGIKALAAMSDAAFLAALKAVPTIKTGRPKK